MVQIIGQRDQAFGAALRDPVAVLVEAVDDWLSKRDSICLVFDVTSVHKLDQLVHQLENLKQKTGEKLCGELEVFWVVLAALLRRCSLRHENACDIKN